MKITKRMLKQLIRQELNYVLNEDLAGSAGAPGYSEDYYRSRGMSVGSAGMDKAAGVEPGPTEREQTQRADQSEYAVYDFVKNAQDEADQAQALMRATMEKLEAGGEMPNAGDFISVVRYLERAAFLIKKARPQ